MSTIKNHCWNVKLEQIIQAVFHENQKQGILREMFPLLHKIIEDNFNLSLFQDNINEQITFKQLTNLPWEGCELLFYHLSGFVKNDKANNGFNYTLRLMFMSIFEKLFSKVINVFPENLFQTQNIINLIKTSIQMIQELHTSMVNQNNNNFNPVTFTSQLIAIAFIKVYFSTYIRNFLQSNSITNEE